MHPSPVLFGKSLFSDEPVFSHYFQSYGDLSESLVIET
jgi:hypothetical protein